MGRIHAPGESPDEGECEVGRSFRPPLSVQEVLVQTCSRAHPLQEL